MYGRQACIAGVGTSDAFGFSLGKSPLTLQAEALRAALGDCGLAKAAIESDELFKISSPFTYRSFVRQFAAVLDVDYEALSSDVQEASGTMPEPLVPGQEEVLPARPSQYQQPKPKRKLSWVYRTASIAAIAGAISGYLIFRNGGILP